MVDTAPERQQAHQVGEVGNPRPSARASRPRLWGLLIAGLAFVWAGFSWWWNWSLVSAVLDRSGSNIAEVYRVNEPGFVDGFREGLPGGAAELFRNGSYGSWWVVAAALVVLVYGWFSAAQIRGYGLTAGHVLAVVAPSLAGIAYFPWGVMEASVALAENGITAPVAIGECLGEATSPAVFGALISASLVVGLLAWRVKAGP